MALGKKNSLKKNEIMFRKASSCLVEMKQKGSGVVVSEFVRLQVHQYETARSGGGLQPMDFGVHCLAV